MSSVVPLASAAAVDLALGATVAANDDDNADGAVFPPSSTENEGAYVGASVRRRLSECVFLYSSFVLFCVRFRMAIGDQLANRVFWEGFPFFNIVELRVKAHFLKVNIARKSFTHY